MLCFYFDLPSPPEVCSPGPTKVGVILQALQTRKVHPCTFTSSEARLDKQVGIYILKFYLGELSPWNFLNSNHNHR